MGLRKVIKRFDARPIHRVEPLEGTRMSLFNSQIPNFWQDTFGTPWYGNAQLAERVWVANRCQQLNSQQIASMPLRFNGPDGATPAWVSAPDPHWYPNGIGDALHAIVNQMYGWGFSCLYVTDIYADGFPRTWTVLDSDRLQIKVENGSRQYKIGEQVLDPARVVQIDRNPSTDVRGCSALSAYAQQAWGLLAAGNQSLAVSDGGVPQAILKPSQRVTEEQAQQIRDGWIQAASSRGTAPAIIPPNLEYQQLSFNPSDLSLLETQEWNARVIATAYGVPAVILNMALQGGLTYQNPAALGEMWWRFELRPTATRIANALTAQMLPRGQWVWFDAADTFAPIDSSSTEDDPQESQVAPASPVQQPLTLIGRERHMSENKIIRTFAADLTPGDGRTVDVRIIPYGEQIEHNDGLGDVPRGEMYREEWAPGVFTHQEKAAHRILANAEHEQGIGGVVGHGITLREGPDGFYGSFKLHDNTDGNKALMLINEGVFDGVSLEAIPVKSEKTREGIVRRVKAHLQAIAFTRFAAYPSAQVLAVREEQANHEVEVEELPTELLPFDMDPETVDRCRRLGIDLPDRYQAHPGTDTSAAADTSESGTRQTTRKNNSEVESERNTE